MVRNVFILVLIFSFSLVAIAGEKEDVYTVDNIPKVHLKDKRLYLCDPENIISPYSRDSINSMLYKLEGKTGIQTVVAVLPSIGDEDVFDFSHNLLNKWGVGQKDKNNGFVIVLVLDKRRIQFYTGYGIEGILPDALCKRIQKQYMVPDFQKGDWSSGLLKGVRAASDILINGEQIVEQKKATKSDLIPLSLLFLLLCLFVGIYIRRKFLRCPNCGKIGLEDTGRQRLYYAKGSYKDMVTQRCKHCGFTRTVEQNGYSRDDDNYRNGGGMFFGGGGYYGGGFSGGGFGGGSFGGGSGGGGGAGTSF